MNKGEKPEKAAKKEKSDTFVLSYPFIRQMNPLKFFPISFFVFLFFVAPGCKKSPPAVTYSNVTMNISLVDYTFGQYAAGAWTTGTKIRIRCAGNLVDSLNSLLGGFNVSQNVSVMNGCNAHFLFLSHTFKIQNGSINSMEFIDQGVSRLSCDVTPSTIYFYSVSDSTTTFISNAGCPMSVFAAR